MVYSEADNYRQPELFYIATKKIVTFPKLGKIYEFLRFDDKNIYSMFILANGTISIYDNNDPKIFAYNYDLANYNLGNIGTSYIKMIQYKNKMYFALADKIKVLTF
jgi:hypothetical protein